MDLRLEHQKKKVEKEMANVENKHNTHVCKAREREREWQVQIIQLTPQKMTMERKKKAFIQPIP